MLTKQDLAEIKKIIDPLREKILDLEEKLDDKTSDIETSIFRLRAENSEEFKHIKRRVSEFKEEFDVWVKHFDRYLQETRREVEKIKSHIKIPSLS